MFVSAPHESVRLRIGEVFEDKRALFEAVARDLESPRGRNRRERSVVVPEHDDDPAGEGWTPGLDAFSQSGCEASRGVEEITEHDDSLGLEPGDACVKLGEFLSELLGGKGNTEGVVRGGVAKVEICDEQRAAARPVHALHRAEDEGFFLAGRADWDGDVEGVSVHCCWSRSMRCWMVSEERRAERRSIIIGTAKGVGEEVRR